MDAAPLNTSIIILCSEVGFTFGNDIVQKPLFKSLDKTVLCRGRQTKISPFEYELPGKCCNSAQSSLRK